MVWTWLLPVLLLANRANAGCTLHDFKWRAKTAPTVTQPRNNDPTKVLVNWAPAIQKNGRCADEWTVIVYPNGTTKANAVKIVNKDKAARSMVVDVQACVNYRFSVEYLEKETFDDRGETTEATFKTKGVPALASNTAPTVTQPRANNPTKVLVNWAPAIQKNYRCADEWTVIMYPSGTTKANATRIINKDKDSRSMVVNVQACVNYRFSVEYLKKETFDDRGETTEATFRTTGVCPVVRNSPNRKKKMKKKIKKANQIRRPGSIIKRVIAKTTISTTTTITTTKSTKLTTTRNSNLGRLGDPLLLASKGAKSSTGGLIAGLLVVLTLAIFSLLAVGPL